MKDLVNLLLVLVTATQLISSSSASSPNECIPPYKNVRDVCVYVDIFNTGTWHEMQYLCRGLDGDLLKLDDLELYYDLLTYLRNQGLAAHDYWIGGSDEGHEGQWEWPDASTVRMGTPFWANYGYENDSVQLPNDGDSSNCLRLNQNIFHYFDDSPCDQMHNVICEYKGPEPGDCPAPYKKIQGICIYVDIFKNGTWHDMSFRCERLGGFLLKLDDLELYYDVIKYLEEYGLIHHDYWIGGLDEELEGQWLWIDGTDVRMGTPFWANYGNESNTIQLPNGGDDENCLRLNQNLFNFFDDSNCFDSYNLICQYDGEVNATISYELLYK